MTSGFSIGKDTLTIDRLADILHHNLQIELSEEARQSIFNCRTYLNNKLKKGDQLYYGINTGFGALCDVKISSDEIEQLQINLVQSHACGVGEEVPQEIVKLMLLLKIQSLSYGHSGIDISTVWRLMDFYNHDVLPVVYQQGSLGASGDLAPLAHLSLPLLGLGEINFRGKKYPAEEILKEFNWPALKLKSKEGLALLNGTQFMSAYAVRILIQAKKYSALADTIACISLDAFDAKLEPFHALLHQLRPHNGQAETAKKILEILKGSEIAGKLKTQVQDPYSFRCIPQVHGASKDALSYAEQVVTTEINAVTDNPNIFPEEDMILSGGNFHGQPLALALDFLAIALSELGSISERRTYQLISGERNLPAFLISNPGLHSGMMITQYATASLVSQNKQLCMPASVDTIPSSNGQEDHVSMGANAATKCWRVLKNLENILAIELLNAAQALEFRRPAKSSVTVEEVVSHFRKTVSFNTADRVLHEDIEKAVEFLRTIDK